MGEAWGIHSAGIGAVVAVGPYHNCPSVESVVGRRSDSSVLSLSSLHLGNKYADEWLEFAIKRLETDIARTLSKTILETDSSLWWFSDKSDWWIKGKEE